jgi:hypothetical protein
MLSLKSWLQVALVASSALAQIDYPGKQFCSSDN